MGRRTRASSGTPAGPRRITGSAVRATHASKTDASGAATRTALIRGARTRLTQTRGDTDVRRIRHRYGHGKGPTPLAIAREDVAAGRFSTLTLEQSGSYWYVGRKVDRPLYAARPDGPQALVFEAAAGPFASRGYAEKIIERARARADREAP